MPAENKKVITKTICLLLFLNFCFLILAFYVTAPLPYKEWRKGPPIHSFSAYSSGNAEKFFLVATAFFFDLYFFIIFLFNYIIKKRRISLPRWLSSMIMIAMLLLSFLFVEYAVRLYIKNSPWYTQFRPHPLLYWYNRNNLRDFVDSNDAAPKSTNSYGFRYKDEIPIEKPANEYRIFVLGDSSAFGHGVYDTESFSAQLEKKLNEDHGKYRFRVINTACPGHTTYEGLIILKKMILGFTPDMIIVAYNNDPGLEYLEEKRRAFQDPFINNLNIILYHSDYYLLLQRVAADFKLALLSGRRGGYSLALVRRVSLEDYKKNIKEFMLIAKQHNVRLIFIKMPVNLGAFEEFPDLKKFFYDENYRNVLTEICRQGGYTLVDIDTGWSGKDKLSLFQSVNHQGQKSRAHFHPNADGHREISEQVYNAITQDGLIR